MSDDAVSDGESGSGSTVNFDAIFSMTEVEEFFAEPVERTEEANDDVGQLVCTWDSIEDPDDLEDLAAQSLFVSYCFGSLIEGSAIFDPELYESPTPIDGIGEFASSSSVRSANGSPERRSPRMATRQIRSGHCAGRNARSEFRG